MTQIKKLFPPLTGQWMAVYKRERPNLSPNAMTGEELCDYVKTKLQAESLDDEIALDSVRKDTQNATHYAQKLHGEQPQPAAFRLPDGTFVGIDRVSGWFFAENDDVRDELTYVKGLDEADLENPFCTVEWLRCRKVFETKNIRKKRPRPVARSLRENKNDVRDE